MKIISKKKDYYDSVAWSKGVDLNLTWVRTEKCTPLNNSILNKLYQEKIEYQNQRCTFKVVLIGFCGTIYTCFEVYKFDTNQLIERFYDIERAKEVVDLDSKYQTWNMIKPLDLIESYAKNTKLLDLFHQLKEPIFLIKNQKLNFYSGQELILETGVLLKDYGFYTQVDSWATFSQIEGFIGGVIGQKENINVERSDRSKIEAKGFDWKWSFRKEKKQ